MGRWKNKVGFTLIELLVVVIIVAILAAVGIPLLSGNVARARASEAEAGIGTIRTAMRARLAEVGTFTVIPTFAQIGLTTNAAQTGGDLDGRFFSDNAYVIQAATGVTYCLNANGDTASGNNAPRAAQVSGTNLVVRSMDELGHIHDALNCGGTILN